MSVRIGFLGTGFMGQLAHLHNYLQVPDCEVVAIAEARPQLGQLVAKRHNIPTVYQSHKELLKDKSIDAVVCSQPYHRNYYLGQEVLAAGKSLFTEKPMTMTLADARELVELAARNKLVYAVGFMKRYDPGIELGRKLTLELVSSQELGPCRMVDITCFCGDWLQNPGEPLKTDEPFLKDDLEPRYPEFLAADQRDFYNHFINIYSHNVNLMHYLLDGREVWCESAHHKDETFLFTLRADDTLISLRGTPVWNQAWDESASVYFERGYIEINSAAPMNRQQVAEVTLHREIDGTWCAKTYQPPIEWAFLRQAKAFVAAVKTGHPIPTSGETCLADMVLIEDIFRKLK